MNLSWKLHLTALEQRHRDLETQIKAEDRRPRPDTELVTWMKIEKLAIKDKIEHLRLQSLTGRR